jgi:hypothetical protein
MTPEQYMREALASFQRDPADTDFQHGYLEGLKVFANEAMGFKWDDPLLWGEGGQPIETKSMPRPKLTIVNGGITKEQAEDLTRRAT